MADVVDRGEGVAVVERRGSGASILIAVVLLLAIMIGAFYLMNQNSRENAETRAITGAAQSVSDSAQSVGDAAQRAADGTTTSN